MSTNTTNYNLTKLDGSDLGAIIDINGNADKIDAALKQNRDDQQLHTENKGNPHSVTKAQVGLENVDNTADFDKPVSAAQQSALNRKADLGSDGKVPAAQLPSYVDDVLEYTGKAGFPATGEIGKIYVDRTTNLTYRWSGCDYVEISPSLALGETAATACRGDRGKIAYDHALADHARADATKTEASEVNGNLKIDGVEAKVYDDMELKNTISNLLTPETIAKAKAAGFDLSNGLGVQNLNQLVQILVNAKIVIERGLYGILQYEKYIDGTSECWGTYTHSVAIENIGGGGYWSDGIEIMFPSGLFKEIPIFNFSAMAGYGVIGIASTKLTPNNALINFWSLEPDPTRNRTYSILAKGRWK